MTAPKDPNNRHWWRPPEGNQFWKNRLSHGRKMAIEDPEELYKKAVEYFNWCDENPIYENIPVQFQGDFRVEELPKPRAYLKKQLCAHIGIAQSTFDRYKEREDFADTIEWIESVIYSQKLQGAAAGLFNASIVAKELGLASKNEITGENGGPILATVDRVERVIVKPSNSNG